MQTCTAWKPAKALDKKFIRDHTRTCGTEPCTEDRCKMELHGCCGFPQDFVPPCNAWFEKNECDGGQQRRHFCDGCNKGAASKATCCKTTCSSFKGKCKAPKLQRSIHDGHACESGQCSESDCCVEVSTVHVASAGIPPAPAHTGVAACAAPHTFHTSDHCSIATLHPSPAPPTVRRAEPEL